MRLQRYALVQLLAVTVVGVLGLGCEAARDPIAGPDGMSDVVASLKLFTNASTYSVGETVEVRGMALRPNGTSASAPVTYMIDDPAIASPGLPGEFSARTAGSVVITASSGGVSSSVRVQITAPATGDQGQWTLCVQAGYVCQFEGLRPLRLGAAVGPYLQQTAFHGLPCAPSAFGSVDPSPGQALHCDYGPLNMRVLNNPSPGMGLASATVVAPLGAPGASTERLRSTSEVPVVTDGSGSFRTTCDMAFASFNDPIVFPGVPGASHLHVFFGNTAVRASTTPSSLVTTGTSTCRGGIVNRTGYWVPAILDSRTGEVQIPDLGIFYYKSGYNMDPQSIQPFPAGLRMIAGDKSSTAQQPNVDWGCRDGYTGPSASIPTTCASTDYMRLEVRFPQCWDGKNLDSPDHKSHMAFPDYRNAPQRSTCPATHPVPLPAITEKFDYPLAGKSPANWRMTSDMYASSLPGGLSAHADWMNGWNPTVMQAIVSNCINRAVDCGVASLGNGTELY